MNFKAGDIVRHKPSGTLGRIIAAPDGASMHWKIDWLTPSNIDRIVSDWFMYNNCEYSELGTILDLESKSRNMIYTQELKQCKRYYEKKYQEEK